MQTMVWGISEKQVFYFKTCFQQSEKFNLLNTFIHMPSSITSSSRCQKKFEQIRYHTNVEVQNVRPRGISQISFLYISIIKFTYRGILRIKAGTPPNAKDTNVKFIFDMGVYSLRANSDIYIVVFEKNFYMMSVPRKVFSP